MPKRNFIAQVKNIQHFTGRLKINRLVPSTYIVMPILLTPDTYTLYNKILNNTNTIEKIIKAAAHHSHSTVLEIIILYKQQLQTEKKLDATGGNTRIVRAMLYHFPLNINMLIKDISYMWDTLTVEERIKCMEEPYKL